MMTVQQAFELALQHHRAGRLADAEALYRQILAVQPEHAEALHFLGVIAHQVGRHDLAIEWINRSLVFNPGNSQAYCNLGEALLGTGRREEAIAAYHRSLSLNPADALVHYNLGNALRDGGRLEEAEVAFRRAAELRPDDPDAQNNLGGVLKLQGRADEAIMAYRAAIQLRPDYAEVWSNLGTVLRHRWRFEEAEAAYQRALALRPDYAMAYNNLGIVLFDLKRYEEALAAYGRAIQLMPALAEVHYNLGGLLNFLGRTDEAVAADRRALDLKPDDALGWSQLGEALKNQGALSEAIEAFRKASRLPSENAALLGNLIYTLHFQVDGESALGEEQARWNQRFSVPVRERILTPPRKPESGRPLRIGYVSPHFRDHVVGRNLVPLFRHHDVANFEIWCYSNSPRVDGRTDELRQRAREWRPIEGMSDEALAAMIREDEIDVLVDLTQHMGGNRLPVFARQPAPVQVSFAGYPESTGVEAIGYRLSDRWLEGEGRKMADGQWRKAHGRTERAFLLDSFWCYDPCGAEMRVNALPAEQGGGVTFGSLNNFCKVNEPLLRLWARVLVAVTDARLVLMSHRGCHRQRTLDFLEREGVPPQRVEFVEPRSRQAYLELYHRLDMVLDPFPYNGHTTSLDALWMGVPVVSLSGTAAVSRAGLSQLNNLGLPELVAHSEDEYVDIARRLAGDLPRLAELRATLRARMEASVLMDAAHFTRQIEEAYRAMWGQCCEENRAS